MPVKLGEIFIALGLSTASFTKGLNDAKKLAFGNAKEIERSFLIMGKAALGASTAIAGALAVLVKSSIDTADRFHDLSQQTGVSVETLSGLSLAAKQSGTNIDDVAKNLGRLARGMFDAASGTGEQAAAFRALGVSIKDAAGNLRPLEQVMLDVADRFASMQDGSIKTALAMKLFGKAGAEMIPFLNEGRAGLTRMMEAARRLGLVISTDIAKAADEFNDQLVVLRSVVEGVGLGILRELLSALNQLLGQLDAGSRGVQDLGGWLGSFLRKEILLDVNAFEQLLVTIARVKAEWKLWTTWSVQGFADAKKEIKTLNAEMAKLQKQAQIIAGKIEVGLAVGAPPPKLESQLATPPRIVDEKQAQAIQKIVEGLRLQTMELQLSPGAFAAYKAGLEGATSSQRAMIAELTETIQRLKEAKGTFIGPQSPLEFLDENLVSVTVSTKEFDDAFQKMSQAMRVGGQIWESTRTPIEAFGLEMNKLKNLFALGAIDQETFARASQKLADSLGLVASAAPAINDALREMVASMRGFAESSAIAFGEWLIRGGSFRQVLQGILQDLARIVFQLLVVRPLINSLFGFGFAEGGLSGGAHHSFQHGGFPPVGKMSIVGERGPEAFIPLTPGLILPNTALPEVRGGGLQGVNITNIIDNRGADLGTMTKTAALVNKLALRQFAQLMREQNLRTV